MLGLGVIKKVAVDLPIVFDVTNAMQQRDPGSAASGGRRHQVGDLTRGGMAVGLTCLFLEAPPQP